MAQQVLRHSQARSAAAGIRILPLEMRRRHTNKLFPPLSKKAGMRQRSNTVVSHTDSSLCPYCVHSQTHMDSTTEHLFSLLPILPFVLVEDSPVVPACAYQWRPGSRLLLVCLCQRLWLCLVALRELPLPLPLFFFYFILLLHSPALPFPVSPLLPSFFSVPRAQGLVWTLIGVTRQERGGKMLASISAKLESKCLPATERVE